MKKVKFNFNDYVHVKLTDHGRKAHRQQYDDWPASTKSLLGAYKPPVEDDEGYSKWQMHELMEYFGGGMTNATLPFCMNALIEIEETANEY